MHGGKILGKIRKHFNYLQVKGEIFLSSGVEDREIRKVREVRV